MKIYDDDEVFQQFKEKARAPYFKAWRDLKEYLSAHDFEVDHPSEEDIIRYFTFLRNVKQVATSSLWTYYSYLNSMFKRKYGWKMQELPRITMYLKGIEVDTKNKAAIFDNEVRFVICCFVLVNLVYY